MRSHRFASHSGLPSTDRKSAVFTAPEPMSMPIVYTVLVPSTLWPTARSMMAISAELAALVFCMIPPPRRSRPLFDFFSVLHHRPPGERRAAQGAGVDGVGIDVQRHLAVVLAHQVLERLHG